MVSDWSGFCGCAADVRAMTAIAPIQSGLAKRIELPTRESSDDTETLADTPTE